MKDLTCLANKKPLIQKLEEGGEIYSNLSMETPEQ